MRADIIFQRWVDAWKNSHGRDMQLKRTLAGPHQGSFAKPRNPRHGLNREVVLRLMNEQRPDQILRTQDRLANKSANIFRAPVAAGTLENFK